LAERVQTRRAETVPSQIQDKGCPGEGDDAVKQMEFRLLRRHFQRHDDDWRIGGQRR